MKPTTETYAELQSAYDHFNKELFEGKLPECLITLQREKNTFGYFSPKRFVNKEHGKTDEIAMNPTYFSIRTIAETLSTLCHEAVHLYQDNFGKPGRGRYHNKEWADKMETIGLMPSSTGKEGGKRTGDRMSHYIIEGGRFDKACKKLLTKDFKISWADRFPPRRAVTGVIEGAASDDGNDDLFGKTGIETVGLDNNPVVDELSGWGIDIEDIPAVKVQTRAKFTCPQCQANVWGKPSLNIICGDCDAEFEECS